MEFVNAPDGTKKKKAKTMNTVEDVNESIAENQAEQRDITSRKRKTASNQEHQEFIDGGANEPPFNSGPAHTDIVMGSDDTSKKRKLSIIREAFPEIEEHGVFLYINTDDEIEAIPSDISNMWSAKYFDDVKEQ
jgi:hypothetical protein